MRLPWMSLQFKWKLPTPELPLTGRLFQLVGEEGGGRRIGCGDFFGSALRDDTAAVASSCRAHINHIVGRFHHIEVVLYYKNCVPLVDKAVEHGQEHLYILEMQPRGRLVEHE